MCQSRQWKTMVFLLVSMSNPILFVYIVRVPYINNFVQCVKVGNGKQWCSCTMLTCFPFTERTSLHQYIDGSITPCVIRQYGPNSVRQQFKIYIPHIFWGVQDVAFNTARSFGASVYWNSDKRDVQYLFGACSVFVKKNAGFWPYCHKNGKFKFQINLDRQV